MAFGRDRVAGIALLAVFAGFAAAVAWAAAGPQLPETGPRLRLVFVWAWGAGAVGLGLRLMRDRRHRYLRSTMESLAVLGSGAILLAVLLSLPSILAELDRMRAV